MSTEYSEKIIVFDLDATLATYEGWDVHSKFPGPPRDDVIDGIVRLKEHGKLIGILSTRSSQMIIEWLKHYKLEGLVDFVNESPWQPDGCGTKPIAFCYVDDRGVRYDGTNMDQIVEDILCDRLEPWYKKIEQNVRSFLKEFGFACAKWDGDKLTCFTKDGQSREMHEFKCRSRTRKQWHALSDKLNGFRPKVIE